jgi:acyl dehydratase
LGRYFDDFVLGEEFTTPGRTVTEADIVAFAGLSGDYNPLHTDAEFAKSTRYGGRIAHGVLGIAIVTGLMSRLGIFDQTAIALLDLNWRFAAPVLIDDTVHATMTVIEKRLSANEHRGIITREIKLLNQRGDIVQEGTSRVMVLRQQAQ